MGRTRCGQKACRANRPSQTPFSYLLYLSNPMIRKLIGYKVKYALAKRAVRFLQSRLRKERKKGRKGRRR